MSENKNPPTHEEVLAAMRESASLTSDGAKIGGTIDMPALEAHARKLDDLNSRFPETREFLEARGLTNVSQLDAEGKAALEAHLKKVLADALAKK